MARTSIHWSLDVKKTENENNVIPKEIITTFKTIENINSNTFRKSTAE